jgi:hypothetical protein
MADLASPIQAFLAIDVITVAARPRFRTVCLNFATRAGAVSEWQKKAKRQ